MDYTVNVCSILVKMNINISKTLQKGLQTGSSLRRSNKLKMHCNYVSAVFHVGKYILMALVLPIENLILHQYNIRTLSLQSLEMSLLLSRISANKMHRQNDSQETKFSQNQLLDP